MKTQPLSQQSIRERQLEVMLDVFAASQIGPAAADEVGLDVASAQRVTTVLRREQAARDGRPLAQAWGRLADRVERDYPAT